MSTATSRELIEAALASVEARVQQQIEAARQRRERERLQRAELTAGRRTGIARRHAAKLRNQAQAGGPELPSRYSPRAREAGTKEARYGGE